MPFSTLNLFRRIVKMLLYTAFGTIVGAVALYIHMMNDRPDLHDWHTVKLDEEFTEKKAGTITSFSDYLQLEERLFEQMQDRIKIDTDAAPRHDLNRFDSGSLADPTSYPVNWNRSFEFKQERPRGGVLLLHGLSDSPYSLLTVGRALYEQGYYVLGLRMPGHGTIPSGLVYSNWQDMAAAVRLAARHVSEQIGADTPLHVFGYSMGAAQAVNYAQQAMQDSSLHKPASLVLISPAIGVSSAAALAVWQSRMAEIPGLEKLAWSAIGPEYDPYKYTSFAINAGDLMHRLTLRIGSNFDELEGQGKTDAFPRTLVLLSLVDATVSTHAVVTNLLDRVKNPGNELVLFDLNRYKQLEPFIQYDPAEAYRRLLDRPRLDFDLTYLTNESPLSHAVVKHTWSQGRHVHDGIPTGLEWPDHVYSLSHVALPFSPVDNLYGSHPEDENGLHIGMLASRGERGVLNVPARDMLRLRFNPFYSFMQERILDFLAGDPESPDVRQILN